MALEFKLKGIKDWETVCYTKDEKGEEVYHPNVTSVALASVAIGMGSITEKNWEEFFFRARCIEEICGPYRTIKRPDGTKGPLKFKPEEIKRYIGFKTNVFPEENRIKFARRILSMLEDRINPELRMFRDESPI